MMNKTVAFPCLAAVVCMMAPAFAQDTHVSLTKESLACVQEMAAALNKATDSSGVAEAVKTVKAVRGKMVDLGKRQLELPGATLQEQAQLAAVVADVQKETVNFTQVLVRLKKDNLFTPELQQALLDLQTVQAELAEAAREKASHAEPFPKDAAGNTQESLLQQTVDEVKKLDAVLAAVKDAETGAAALAQVARYRAAFLDIAGKQAGLPPLTRNQQARLQALQMQLVEMMQPMTKHMTAAMVSPAASDELKEALKSLKDLPAEVQKVREKAAQ